MFDNWVLCLHRGGDGPNFLHDALSDWIKFWTGSKFSHAELFCLTNGLCFSADGYENKVRWKKIEFSHPERWTMLDLGHLSAEESTHIMARANSIVGARYDYLGAVMCRKSDRKLQASRRWYCFEAVGYALDWPPYQRAGNQLYEEAIRRGARLIG